MPDSCNALPVVLSLAGHDPTGGAGIRADSEALRSMGCHAATVVTALTVQDTHRVHQIIAVDPELVRAQALAVLGDMRIAAVKIGVLATSAIVSVVSDLLDECGDLPVVLDPVLQGGGGGSLSDADLPSALRRLLLPRTTVLTPNAHEACRLAPQANGPEASALALLRTGCQTVLLTGGDDDDRQVVNRLYGNEGLLSTYVWERLPGHYHGSGCTLAAALAGRLARGEDPVTAAERAQLYAWTSLRRGYRPGTGQLLPNRVPAELASEQP